MKDFKLTSKFAPTGDQPEAIKQLTEGLKRGDRAQVLLGVTGSGKTFTVANVIANANRPTLILSHNKTLAAQLYSEMKAFFPSFGRFVPFRAEIYFSSKPSFANNSIAAVLNKRVFTQQHSKTARPRFPCRKAPRRTFSAILPRRLFRYYQPILRQNPRFSFARTD